MVDIQRFYEFIRGMSSETTRAAIVEGQEKFPAALSLQAILRQAPDLETYRLSSLPPERRLGFLAALSHRVHTEPKVALEEFRTLLISLQVGGILLVTVTASNTAGCNLIDGFIAHASGMECLKRFMVSGAAWVGWLIRLQESSPSLVVPPPLSPAGGLSEADHVQAALNGDHDALARLQSLCLNNHPVGSAIALVHRHVLADGGFRCTGWTHVDLGADALCYIGGVLQVRRDDGTTATKRVCGCGPTWADAAFRLLCESVERRAVLLSPYDTTGSAFGFSRAGAMYRGALERLERAHLFDCLYRGKRGIRLIPKENSVAHRLLRTLSGNGRTLDLVLMNPPSLEGKAPFHAVAALSRVSDGGPTGTLSIGASCQFNIEAAAEKAIFEAIQLEFYAKSDNFQNDINVGILPPQYNTANQYWSQVSHWQNLSCFLDVETLSIPSSLPCAPSEDEACADLLSAWANQAGLHLSHHVLTSPDTCRKGLWVCHSQIDGPPGSDFSGRPPRKDPPSPFF